MISRKRLKEAAVLHPDLETPLDVWFRIAKQASWQSLADIRKTLASADQAERYTVFNIKGNKYRLVTEINYRFQRVYIRHVLTHADYSREGWKK